MVTLKPLSEKIPEDCRLLYSIYTQDIRFAKQQLWRITYYALILMSAIAYFTAKTESPCWVSMVLIALLACISILWLLFIHKDINGYRKIIGAMDKTKPNNRNQFIDKLYPIIFVSTISIAAFLLCFFPISFD